MIIEHKKIELFGKMLFEKAIIRAPFRKSNPMPDEACFLYIQEGSYNSISENEFLTAKKGQSVLMKCGNYLSQMIGDTDSGIYKAVAIHFHPDVLRKVYSNDLPNFLYDRKSNLKSSMALIKSSIPIDKYIEDINFYFDNPQLVNDDILAIKIKEIILLLMQTENSPKVIEILENLFSKKSVDFKTIIESHLFSDLSIGDYAQLTNTSLSAFKRNFKAYYDQPPLQYIQGKRLEKAKKLLDIADLSVSDIAFDCGFNSISHFSKKFKDEYGISPSKYRKGHLNK